MLDDIQVLGRDGAVSTQNKVLRNTYMMLGLTMIPTVIGAVIGMGINFSVIAQHPFIAFGAFMLVTMGMQMAITANRNSSIGVALLFVYTFLLGLMLGPILQHAAHLQNGAQLVGLAAGSTGLIFLTMAAIGATTKKDFSYMGKFLSIGVMVVFIAIIANIFLHLPAFSIAISSIFVMISSAFIMYEVNQIVRGGETNYVMATLSLFISIYNIFTSLLNILMSFSGRD
ncbi:MAG: Bax inhibitor-1/YccA family protein [Bdellovibrio sp.]|nr:Bax inhibitor-1/YccA family protein [Methylotenera sp.]